MVGAGVWHPYQLQNRPQDGALPPQSQAQTAASAKLQTRPPSGSDIQNNIPPLALLAMQNWFGKGKRPHYLCQDEMRVGLKTETGRVITASGAKPVAQVGWERENFWVYGVVEPHSG